MPRKFKRNLSLVKLFEVDSDSSGDISPDELRDLADDLEDKPLTGQKLRDALISDISDMHKDIYGMRPRAEFNKMSTEELEKIHDKIDQEHKDWFYEERVQDDLEDLAMARGLDDESIEDLAEPEEGEDMPKQMGMGRRRMKEGTIKITKQRLVQLIKEEISRVVEADVIDMFSDDQKKSQGEERIARALAARAEEMIDVDDDSPNYVEVMVDPKLFLTPYITSDGRQARPLAQEVYEDYVSGKAGDQAENLDSILGRIEIDYFDEPIEDALKALGDDRFDGTQDQMMKTKDLASQQDSDEVEEMGMDFERFLQGIESGDVIELEKDDD